MTNLHYLASTVGYENAVKKMDQLFMDEFYLSKKERRYPRYSREEMSQYLKFTSDIKDQSDYDEYQEKCNDNLLKYFHSQIQ